MVWRHSYREVRYDRNGGGLIVTGVLLKNLFKTVRLSFRCPKCRQMVRPDKWPSFECKHKGTPHEKGMLSDPDKFLLDEVIIDIDEVAFKEV